MDLHASNNGNSNEDAPPVEDQLENLDVRSAEVQEIIGRPPHWMVRGGITGFFGVLILILLSASVIKYPEVINAPIRLTAINEPKLLETKINGKLVNLFVENNKQVKQGQVLGWMESTAYHKEVLELSALADSMSRWLQQEEFQRIRSVRINRFNDLGELQSNFQTFEQAYRTFITFLPGGFYSRKRQMLQQEMKYTRRLLNNLEQQKKIQEINLKLAKQEYEAQKKLADKQLIAPIDFSKAESKVVASRLPLQQTESAIINNYASQTAKEKELLEMDKQMTEQTPVFRQALNTLKSAIDRWKMDYLLRAPLDGKLIYAGIIQENQTLKAGQPVAYIQPENTRFFGEMVISQRSFGKIREGQRVLVRFSGYPDQEFGSVTGNIDYLSEFPVQDSVFLAKVTFPDCLNTNYGQKLHPVNGMRGQAEIITQDMKLLERFYNNIAKQLR
jgi:HlyD family secretion protein